MALGEFELIEWVRRRVGEHPRVPLGIGDDAAVFRVGGRSDCLLAADMLLDGVHFRLVETAPRLIGRKALAVNLSDIAAMAGRPTVALLSVALPRGCPEELPRELHDGLLELADEFDVAIAGGDTNSWNGPLALTVTVVGEPVGRGPVRRSGARVGDWILVTGEFGGSLADRHLTFRPRVEEAIRLHEAAELHALIDVSDGLAADLFHVLDESGVGAVVRADAIPISAAARSLDDGRSPLEHALGDGEDFELIFTLAPEEARSLLAAPPCDLPLAHVGEIVAEKGCGIISADGTARPLERSGWQHRF